MKTKKQEIKQKIIATLVISFMFIMISGTFNVASILAATTTYTNLVQNFVAGNLELEAPNNVAFNNLAVGIAENSLANLDQVNMRDYRGSGAGWTVIGYTNNLQIATAGVNNVSNASIWWNPGTLTNFQGSSTGVSPAAGWASLDAQRTLVSASTNNGMGNYRVSNTALNIVYNGRSDQLQGTYTCVLTMTIS
jgi:hypothetical protein